MNRLTEIVDRIIIAVYLAAVFTGVLVSTSYDIKAEGGNKTYTDIRRSADSQSVSDIMNAYDFLGDSEKPADYESIQQYLEEFKNGKLKNNKEVKDEDENSGTSESDAEDVEDNISNIDEHLNDDEEQAGNGDDNNIEIDKDDWRLVLVNKQNEIPEDFEVELSSINGSLSADERIIGDIYDMLNGASLDGINLMICSAYRSYDRQTVLFDNKMNKLMSKGMSYLESYKEGSMSVTPPGTSEHQTGLALDILTGGYTEMDDGFGDTDAGEWLRENSVKYGFILRYPKGKEDITGIVYEPWHFRYVGKEYAEIITERGVCLEEFLNGDY